MLDIEKLNLSLFEFTNTVRLSYGLKNVLFSNELSMLSSIHSTQMKKYGFFSHTNAFNVNLKDLKDRVSYFDFSFTKVTENIADIPLLNSLGENEFEIREVNNEIAFFSKKNKKQFFYHTIDSFSIFVITAWMNSTGHRKNILDKDVTHLGCGAVIYYRDINNNGIKIPYLKVTQNFARR